MNVQEPDTAMELAVIEISADCMMVTVGCLLSERRCIEWVDDRFCAEPHSNDLCARHRRKHYGCAGNGEFELDGVCADRNGHR